MNALTELIRVFTNIQGVDEMRSFFKEIFTPKEIEDFALRWQLLKDLHAGKSQRKIAIQHKMSLCKITRGSKVLKKRNSTTKKILDNMEETT